MVRFEAEGRIPLANPIREFLRAGVLVLGVLLWGQGSWAEAEAGPLGQSDGSPATVILVSMDGTRPADLTHENLPFLNSLAHEWLRAERLLAVSPTNTFPNHVTLVTGVKPERHGIVNNHFIDPEKGRFDRDDIPRWIQVEPLWSLLERKGVPTASYHWVGSEGAWPGGAGPRHWIPFSSATPAMEKVEAILDWLTLSSPGDRPRFISTWFHGADHAGHRHGPGHPAVTGDLRRQDQALAALWQGLKDQDLLDSTTLLVVSDHGMASVRTRVDLKAALSEEGIASRVLGIGGFASVYLEGASAFERTRAVQVARQNGLVAHERGRAPQSLAVANPRFGDVIVLAPPGTAIAHAGLKLKGFHGYPPEDPEMAGIFVAAGHHVPEGVVVPVIRSIDIAPTILALLEEPVPSWMEGMPLPQLASPAQKVERLTSAKRSARAASEESSER